MMGTEAVLQRLIAASIIARNALISAHEKARIYCRSGWRSGGAAGGARATVETCDRISQQPVEI
jgi:hypothetical protein